MGSNYRWEGWEKPILSDDGQVIAVMGESYTVHDETCTQCGQTFQVKGVMGGLREIMFGKVCPSCSPPPIDEYEGA